ncbi:MAG: argininosuccinate synthase [Candidatus Omnitrophica bacterium]|nr:argininosuccinate synthase [Candidatus Omnitrophota bacterium]
MARKDKVVLAYSGGLDTSCCLAWLQEERGLDVITFTADLGGEFKPGEIQRKARASGALKCIIRDLKDEFIRDFCFPALKAQAVYESGYTLGTALGRPLIAKHLVDVARREGAQFVSHGCTGKGNDQVRIEVGVSTLGRGLQVIAPLREWDLKTREEEREYLKERGLPFSSGRKTPYSIDRNLWGGSIECGALENPWVEPPEEVYGLTKSPAGAPQKPQVIRIGFRKGVPVSINGRALSPVHLVKRLNALAGMHGVGRSDLVEDRLVGIKSREIYEAPAATTLLIAHRGLENLVLTREVIHYKEALSNQYAQMVYGGLWFTPLKRALDAFFDETQKDVTGEVKVKLFKGSCQVVGRRSAQSRYRWEWATYSAGDRFDRTQAAGFIKLWGLPYERAK